MNGPTVVFLGTDFDHLYKARAPLLRALVADGARVVALTPPGRSVKGLELLSSWGVEYQEVPLRRAGLNPFGDLEYFRALIGHMRREAPDVLLACTAKAIIYGVVVGRLVGVRRIVAMITGLGYAFTEGAELKRRIARLAGMIGYWLTLRLTNQVVMQNADDKAFLVDHGLCPASKIALVAGSGVDTQNFQASPLPPGPPVVLMVSRLLTDKGVREYVAAAGLVTARKPEVRFVLVGDTYPNPSAIPRSEIDSWAKAGVVEHIEGTSDVRPYLEAAHLFVLPSYREGTPIAVLEAMSTGRAIVTTDVPGCRETVRSGVNGLLAPAKDAAALAAAIEEVLADPDTLVQMGRRSREIAERVFDSRKVARETLGLVLSSRDRGGAG